MSCSAIWRFAKVGRKSAKVPWTLREHLELAFVLWQQFKDKAGGGWVTAQTCDGQRQYGRLRLPNDALAAAQTSLENEGVLTTWYVAAKGDAVVGAKLDRARDVSNRAIAGVKAAGRELGSDDVSASTQRAWDGLEVRMDTLPTLRRQVDELAGLPAAFGDRYSNLDDDVLDVSERLARDVSDRQLSDSMLGIVDLRREQAASVRDAMIVLPYITAGSSTQFNEWIASLTAQDAASAKFLASATPAERSAFEQAARGVVARRQRSRERRQCPGRVPEGHHHAGGVLRELAQEAGLPR